MGGGGVGVEGPMVRGVPKIHTSGLTKKKNKTKKKNPSQKQAHTCTNADTH